MKTPKITLDQLHNKVNQLKADLRNLQDVIARINGTPNQRTNESCKLGDNNYAIHHNDYLIHVDADDNLIVEKFDKTRDSQGNHTSEGHEWYRETILNVKLGK